MRRWRRTIWAGAFAVALGASALVGPQAQAGAQFPDCASGALGHFGYSPNMTDHTVSVIDLDTNVVVGTITGFQFPWNVAISPDGTRLYVDDSPAKDMLNSGVDVVDVCSRTIVKKIRSLGLAFSYESPDQKTVWETNISNVGIQRIDTATGQVVQRYLSLPLAQGALSVDNKTLWSISLPGLVYSVDARTGLPNGLPIVVGIAPAQFAISPDGSTLAVANLEGTVVLINTHTRRITARLNLGLTSYPAYATFSPDSGTVWVGTYSGQVAVADVATGKVVRTLDPGGWAAGVSFSPDGSTVYVSTTPAGSFIPQFGIAQLIPVLADVWKPGGLIRVYDAHTYAQKAVITTGNVPLAVAIPNGGG